MWGATLAEQDTELPGEYEGPGKDETPAHEAAEPPKLSRKRTFSFDKAELIKKVLDEYEADLSDRSEWSEQRLQRYAKYRNWLEEKTQPWPGASNASVPLIMTDCQRMIDTLVNAVLTQRPVMGAQAVNEADRDKGDTVDALIDYQFFLEQNGEERVQEFADSFIVDGTAISFQPYIKEDRKISDVRTFAPLQPGFPAEDQIRLILDQAFPQSFVNKTGDDPWGWTVKWLDENRQDQTASVEFYTDEDNHLVMVAERDMRLFDGPCFIPKPLEDIVVPSRAANLQMPGPSNPNGADHVTMVDYPSWDEIKRLAKSRYYDQISQEELDAIDEDPAKGAAAGRESQDPAEHKILRDALAGQDYGNSEATAKTLTRLTYFGRYDVDNDGLEEDVVFWVLKEHRQLLKVCLLNEKWPAIPPRRPFAEARMIPVPGQFYGIGMVELLEGMHDMMKAMVDQSIDKNTLVNTPWFLYRAASGMRPEVIKCAPGEGYPVSNPAQDMSFPQIPNPDQTTSMNFLALFQQWADKQVVLGDLDFGRVPQGKASALRTVGGMQTVLQQGDARPERLLRRFFAGLAQVWQQFHELNQAFLPPNKQYRVASMTQPGKNPYRTLDDPSKIRGRFQFEFRANSLNTNKASQAQVLQQLGPMLFNGMTFQMGLADPEKFYTYLRKMVASVGQEPHDFLNPPAGDSDKPKLTADQVLFTVVEGYAPHGVPQEGPQAQLQIFQDFMMTPEYGQLHPGSKILLKQWLSKLQQIMQQQQQMAMQAQAFAQMQSGGGGGPATSQGQGAGDGMTMTPQGPGQVMDESLPGAKGQVL